jgi:hypothetical protein
MSKKKIIEGVDFNWAEFDGLRFKVFTEKFLLERGYCCNNNCMNCPYKKRNKNGKQTKS